MEYSGNIFGKTVHLTAQEALRRLELSISEGLLAAGSGAAGGEANLFGRPVMTAGDGDLSFVAGLASTGLRTAAILGAEELRNNAGRLERLAGQHLPVVIHLTGGGGEVTAAKGFFRFFAGTAQEAVDLAIIAHKVAELALIPGVVEFTGEAGEVTLPSGQALCQFLGNADEIIGSPTPAQQMLFGKNRRRIPSWFNLDFPSLNGLKKAGREKTFDLAARRQYFYRHLPEIIKQVMEAYAGFAGRRYAQVEGYQSGGADFLVLACGGAAAALRPAVDELRSREKAKVGCLNLRVGHPFPEETLASLVAGKKTLTVLGPLTGDAPAYHPSLYFEAEAALSRLGKKAPALWSGFYGDGFSAEAARAVFRNMLRGGQEKEHFFVDIEFTRSHSGSPQQEVLLQSIDRAYPGIEGETLRSAAPSTPSETAGPNRAAAQGLPAIIRRFQDQGPPYTRLSRFFHDTAYFYASGREEELVADPFQSLDILPAATAPLAGLGARRAALPVFDPGNCTGCGQCVVYCPHAALPPLAIGVEALIRGAMDIAAKQGTPVSQLTPLVRNLARAAAPVITGTELPVTRAADFLAEVFEKTAPALNLSPEKAAALRQEWTIIMEIIGSLPVAVTQKSFTEGEQRGKGQGELFSLAVDVAACTGCGVCAEVCAEDALVMQPQDQQLVDQWQQTFGLWEQLPDTNAETIHRLAHDPGYDPLAAVLLSRNYYLSMTGGSANEEAAPAKAMLHLVTAVTESVVQPRIVSQVARIGELVDQLSEHIHDKLSAALPRDNFRSLLESVGEGGGERLPLDEVISKLAAREHLQLVDTHSLQRKIELVDDLKELRWALTAGPTGTGRARYGMVLASEQWPWADQYPYNVFLSPVLLDRAAPDAELLTGLFQGHLRHLVDNIKLLRRAKLEIKDKYRPEIHDPQIAALRWEDLEPEEKELIPPLLLVADEKYFNELAPRQLQLLLASPWPVKVIVIDDARLPVGDHPELALSQGQAAILSAVTLGAAYVLQGSTAAPRELFTGLREGLHRPGPALFRLLAPDTGQRRDQAGNGPATARLAVESRAFPVFSFDPQGERETLSAAFALDANTGAETDWYTRDSAAGPYTLTYADWLFTRQEWADHFQPYAPEAGPSVPVAAFLALDPEQQKGKTPVITGAGDDGVSRQWTASPQVVAATRAAGRRWRLLREIAGTFTPFPARLKEAVERELEEKHLEAIATLRREYEEKLRSQEHELMQQVKIRLREKLLDLSQRKI